MRNAFRSFVLLGALLLGAGCSSDSPFGLSRDVEAKIVSEIVQIDYFYEVAITNHSAAPIFVERCQGVERRVGLSWTGVAHMSVCATIQGPERVEAGQTLIRSATISSYVLADEAPEGGTFRFVFTLTESESFASPETMDVRTGAFEL